MGKIGRIKKRSRAQRTANALKNKNKKQKKKPKPEYSVAAVAQVDATKIKELVISHDGCPVSKGQGRKRKSEPTKIQEFPDDHEEYSVWV